jgi:TolB-like protein
VTRDELADMAWAGTVVGDDAVTNAIIKLRKAFGDDTRASKLIETIPKRGYRLLVKARPLAHAPHAEEAPAPPGADLRAMPPTIAVLPFRNLSADAEQDYFSDGITEDLTTALSNTGWYQVSARHAAFSYKGKAIDPRQVGEELGVRYILEGSVRRMADRLRVTAQLIEAGSGKTIWGHHYDGVLADVFDFQDQITETIVGTVEAMFQRAEGERVRQKRPESMEAYDYLLRGLAHMNKLVAEDTRIALQYFYKAIEKDPAYGRAYAYAFWCYRREVQLKGMTLSAEEQAEAIRLMEAGLKADRDDPIVLWQAATLKAYFERDFEGALALLERSLSIDPNSPRAWNTSALVHCFMGESETARKHAEHAIRISPRNPTHWVSYTHIAEANLQEMRYHDAAEAAKKALQLNSDMVPAHLVLVASCAHLGRFDEARTAVKQALRLNPGLTIARLSDLFPIGRYKNLDAYLKGLRTAGLPD